jgi:hypothetical protein
MILPDADLIKCVQPIAEVHQHAAKTVEPSKNATE